MQRRHTLARGNRGDGIPVLAPRPGHAAVAVAVLMDLPFRARAPARARAELGSQVLGVVPVLHPERRAHAGCGARSGGC